MVDYGTRKCKQCREVFKKLNPLMHICSFECAIEYKKKLESKKWRKEKKKRKEELKTRTDHLNELQKIFNKYIRLRDKGKPCISCNKPWKESDQAGHCFSVGSTPTLRFHIYNVNSQCVHCNLHKHGAATEYMINLPKKIGKLAFNALVAKRHEPLKLTLDQILQQKKLYKQKIKDLS